MRTAIGGIILFFAVAIPVLGQSTASSFFTAVKPRDVKFVPVDTGAAMKKYNLANTFRTPAQSKPFNLGNVLPKLNLMPKAPIVPNTPVLAQKNNQFQPKSIFGKNPFNQTPTK